MDQYCEKASLSLIKLGYGLTEKQSSALVPLSKSLGSPAPQTSLVFELPDELILSILSHISPGPRFADHHARFRVQYSMEINNHRKLRARFLLPLSMTCKAMRFRFLPWIWEHVEPSWGNYVENLETIAYASCADVFLGTSVKFMTLHDLWNVARFPFFVKCLESLPNLHTLEIGRADIYIKKSLKDVLKRSKFPQIKALILPACAHPLIKCCCNAELIDCVVNDKVIRPDKFLGFLASIRNSNVKQLAIPLVSCGDQSRYLAACPQLTELTVFWPHPHPRPHPHDTPGEETRIHPGAVETTRPAMLELVNACRELPNFDTLQIVHFSLTTSPLTRDCWPRLCGGLGRYTEQEKQAMSEQIECAKDWAIDCLNEPEKGRQEGEGRKKIALREWMRSVKDGKPRMGRKKKTLRAIELNPAPTVIPRHPTYGASPMFHLGSVKVEEWSVTT